MAIVQPLEAPHGDVGTAVDSAFGSDRALIATRIQSIQDAMDNEPVALAVLPDEDPRKLADRLETWTRDMAPTTDAERFLVREVVGISWKLDRANRFEVATLSQNMIEAIKESESSDPVGLARDAALAAFDASSAGERLRRYQFALIREMRQSLDTFAKLQKQSRLAANERSEAAEREQAQDVAIKPVHAGRSYFPLRAELPAPAIVVTKAEASAPVPTDHERAKLERPNPAVLRRRVGAARQHTKVKRPANLDAVIRPDNPVSAQWHSVSCERT